MKKYLAIVFSILFVLGLAGTAFAIHAQIPSETQAVVAKGTTQVTLGGSIRIRGEYRNNTSDFDDNLPDNKATYDQRVRLSLDAKVSDNVSGFVMVESGDSNTADTWTWGEPNDGAAGVYGYGNAKSGDLRILQAWVLYKGENVGLKVGHMPLALGNKLFFDHRKFGDDAIVLFKDIDNVHLALLTAKFKEELATAADDANAYVALAVYKGDGFTISGDITWVNDNDFLDDPDNDSAREEADLYNIGLRGDFTVGSIAIKADIELQSGDTTGGIASLGCTGNCDFGGTAFLLAASTKVNDVNLGLEFGMGSGDDNAADGDIDLFVTSLSSGVPYVAFVYGTRTSHASGFSNAGISNTTYVKASASTALTDAASLKADLILLRATEDNAAGEDEIGTEIDAKLTYNLAKNLKYWVEGGYLFAGDYYGTNADDAYAIRHGLELTF